MKLLQYLEQDPKDPAPSFLGLSQAEADRRLKEEGKKPLTSREKASGAAVFTPPYTPGAPMISLVWQGKRGRRGCPPVRW